MPSRSTVDNELYERLAAMAADRNADTGPSDPALRPGVESALFHEARLLDSRQYRSWLSRFSDDCVYWIPLDPEGDPREQVSFFLDDKRRMEDRIGLLETGWAHAQTPASRTRRTVSNVEAWPLDNDEVLARCSVVTWEYRRERLTPFVSRNDYILSSLGDDWSVQLKIVELVDSHGDVRKFSFLL
jgi:3-phenylpropionate/cinnamic acid dioxygenase small subunit